MKGSEVEYSSPGVCPRRSEKGEATDRCAAVRTSQWKDEGHGEKKRNMSYFRQRHADSVGWSGHGACRGKDGHEREREGVLRRWGVRRAESRMGADLGGLSPLRGKPGLVRAYWSSFAESCPQSAKYTVELPATPTRHLNPRPPSVCSAAYFESFEREKNPKNRELSACDAHHGDSGAGQRGEEQHAREQDGGAFAHQGPGPEGTRWTR